MLCLFICQVATVLYTVYPFGHFATYSGIDDHSCDCCTAPLSNVSVCITVYMTGLDDAIRVLGSHGAGPSTGVEC